MVAEPSLFDVVDPDGTRTPGIFRAPAPKRVPRPAPDLADTAALADRVAELREAWAGRVAAARARIDTPAPDPEGASPKCQPR